MRRRKLIALAAVITVVEASSAVDLVTNGSFESGDFKNDNVKSRPEIMLISPGMTNITGWEVSGSQQGVHWIEPLPDYQPTIPDGVRVLDLGGAPSISEITTTVPTVTGRRYILSFTAFKGAAANSGSVSIGSLTAAPFEGGEEEFELYELPFIATSDSSKLSFRVTRSNGNGPVIDNVAVHALSLNCDVDVDDIRRGRNFRHCLSSAGFGDPFPVPAPTPPQPVSSPDAP